MKRSQALVLVLFLGGCRACTDDDASQAAGPSASLSAPAPIVTSSVGPWKAAASGDPLALRALTDAHTAPELAAIARGGPQAEPALEALVHAPDAELALGALAKMVHDPQIGEQALKVVVAIARRPPRRTEPLDPPGLAACIEALDTIARDTSVSRPHRVMAVSALHGFARAGYLPSERIPTDLDGFAQ